MYKKRNFKATQNTHTVVDLLFSGCRIIILLFLRFLLFFFCFSNSILITIISFCPFVPFTLVPFYGYLFLSLMIAILIPIDFSFMLYCYFRHCIFDSDLVPGIWASVCSIVYKQLKIKTNLRMIRVKTRERKKKH